MVTATRRPAAAPTPQPFDARLSAQLDELIIQLELQPRPLLRMTLRRTKRLLERNAPAFFPSDEKRGR